MSRVADALRLARLERPGADAFTAHAHPWSHDLEEAPLRESAFTSERHHAGQAASRSSFDEPRAAAGRTATETIRMPEVGPAASPLDDLAPNIRQQIAGVVDQVFLSPSRGVPRMVAFAAVGGDAQSGWIAAAVADMLAQRAAANVAIVDLNFVAPMLHDCFQIEQTPGLVEALESDLPLADWGRQVRPNLRVIPAGVTVGITELTADSRARISRLASAYDHVIVALDPVSSGCSGGLAAMADGIVLVIAADATRREAARKAAERLQSTGATILGAVLTNRRYAIPEAIYKRL